MKLQYIISLLCTFPIFVFGQNNTLQEQGTISYLSPANIYVKFEDTEKISVGDTLYFSKNKNLIPALIVKNKSSISCVCDPINENIKLNKSDVVIFNKIILPKKELPKVEEKPIEENKEEITTAIPIEPEKIKEEELIFKENIRARISAASYSNMSDERERHRMRYAFSFKGNNLKNSRFSTDNYITFRHTIGEWDRVQANLNDALKIYALSIKYNFNKNSSFSFGRKINQRISSMGAVDGLQLEHGFKKNWRLGTLLGSRPDYSDYSINLNLIQVGAYLALFSDPDKKYHQSTFGFIEQRNHSNIDRRFIYFQHSDALLKNLNLFTSFEMDLYEKINGEEKNNFKLTNFYTSLRYRFSRKFSISTSYDNRRNIIYYESYKHFIDQLIDNETRQGFRAGFVLRPLKPITMGMNTSLRFQKNQGNVSKNLNGYMSINRITNLNIRASLRMNFLETGYLKSKIYSLRLSKSLFKKKVSATAYYRMVNYIYKNNEVQVHQDIVGANISFRILKKLSMYVYYEGTFNKERPTLTRFNTKIIQRF